MQAHTQTALIALLLAHGFAETRYDEQQGIFYSKKLPVRDMPYMMEHVVDDELVGEIDIAVVEITPDFKVQMVVLETDYSEADLPLTGADYMLGVGLLADAGVPRSELEALLRAQ